MDRWNMQMCVCNTVSINLKMAFCPLDLIYQFCVKYTQTDHYLGLWAVI